ncbi:glycine/betaine ABC transporter [Paenibacillus sambharensis]|uniref:Glycine/betaine ABC transporter n=1 Tax=Paenibacillus sambharensis TaxID=1803190 RepID=A0A2W1L628_9BACL|nr:glycine betaine ABC transporter substrate-binding protein [Paenibacillus sambharensis]PZD95618.1 glycine/betaine ABC transporter [Paenibacillus sambharensis]
MKKWTVITALILVAALLGACSNSGNEGGSSSPKTENKSIKLAYVAWDSEIASTNVVKHVLESKLNYKVEMLQVDAGPMWVGLADGSADAMVAAWLPSTHESYMEKYAQEVVDLGPNLDGTKTGLAVPAYMEINSIDELADAAAGEGVNYQIIGIEPGAGIMMATERALEEYALSDWTLVESSSAAMAQQLIQSYDEQKPVIVTAWTPHWMFANMELKYLEDPKGVYGGEEQIHTIVRKGLEEDKADAYKFLDQFEWTADEMAAVMIAIQEGKSPEEAAGAWVEANADKVNTWLEGIE